MSVLLDNILQKSDRTKNMEGFMENFIQVLTFNVLPLLFAIIFHEISHGLAAYALGDDTAKRAGRFKLYTHFDLWGSFLIPLSLYAFNFPFLIGYAKPVPINPLNFKKPIRDMAFVAIAGPLFNFVAAMLSIVLLHHISNEFWILILFNFTFINLGLFFFNMIPIPPLDGSRILAAVLPRQHLLSFYKLEPFGFLIIIGLELLSNLLSQLFGCNMGLFYTFVEIPTKTVLSFLIG